jgi:transposase
MATIAGHLSIEELEGRYRGASAAVEGRHYQAIWLLARGRTFVEVADVLGFVPRWVEELAQRYNAQGPGALGDQRRKNGRPATVLTAALLAALAERLKTPPDDGGLWSGPKVAHWMGQRLGRADLHPQRGWDALKALDYSIQRPRPRHAETADEGARAAFKKSSTRRSPRRLRRTRTSRSWSGPPTSTGSA